MGSGPALDLTALSARLMILVILTWELCARCSLSTLRALSTPNPLEALGGQNVILPFLK